MNRNRVAPQDTLAIRNFYIVSKTKKKKKKKKRQKGKKEEEKKKLYQDGQRKKIQSNRRKSIRGNRNALYPHRHASMCAQSTNHLKRSPLSTANPSKCRNIFRIGFFLNHFTQIHEATAVELQNF